LPGQHRDFHIAHHLLGLLSNEPAIERHVAVPVQLADDEVFFFLRAQPLIALSPDPLGRYSGLFFAARFSESMIATACFWDFTGWPLLDFKVPAFHFGITLV
jgi:hypothetical protein